MGDHTGLVVGSFSFVILGRRPTRYKQHSGKKCQGRRIEFNDSASSGCSQSASCEMTFTMDNGLLNVLFRWGRIVIQSGTTNLFHFKWNI